MPKTSVGHRQTSPVQEDYLKALFRLAPGPPGSPDGGPVTNAQLTEELGVSPGSVSEMLSKLSGLGLVAHDAYRGARLSPAGRTIAIEMVRHHRLIETYLVRALGYGWDEVHEEADRLEHAISEVLEERMWLALGKPAFDPHGDPIPTPDFQLPQTPTVPLPSVSAGTWARISRISDRDPAKLRALQHLLLLPGRRLRLARASLWESPVTVEVEGVAIEVPLGLARAVHVEVEDG